MPPVPAECEEGVGALDGVEGEDEEEDDEGEGADLKAARTEERNDDDETMSAGAEGWGAGVDESGMEA